ncbi:MAG: DNA polymerase III subunit beta [Rickettsiales bacterium]|nr:DNA polymerase III subunit beta [Rickettsiales bacterium]
MKLSIERSVLLKALGHVQSVVERRGTIPILSNVKLEADGDTLRLTSTDMDIAVAEKIAANVSEAGALTVPAHMFYEIVRKLPDGSQIEISKEAGDAKVSVSAGRSRFSLSSLPVEDFPVMAEDDLEHTFTITAAECQALVEKTRFAISTEETRYYLNGVFLHKTDDDGAQVLRAVATDGHRLARIQIALPSGAENIPGVIIPRKTIAELFKLIEEGVQNIEISLSETKIRFVCGDAVLVSKLIDGTFPDYDRVIPTGNDKIMEVNGKLFSEAVDRVSVISSEKSRGIKLELDTGKLTLSASSAEQGNAVEEIEVNYGADRVEIGFNSRYLLDMMGQIEDDTAQFVFADASSPALVRDPSDVGALYVIMPMRV